MDNQYNLSPVKKIGLASGLKADSSKDYTENVCLESINLHFDSGVGEATIRKGTTQLGSRVDITPILGIYEFQS